MERAQKHDDAKFRYHLKLESKSPFSVLQTVSHAPEPESATVHMRVNQVTLMEGPLKGRQVIVLDQSPPFRFLDLPREIRDEIYTYAMVPEVLQHEAIISHPNNNGYIRFRVRRKFPSVYHRVTFYSRVRRNEPIKQQFKHKESLTPGLLLTSKQVYEESLPVLYGRNHFVIPGVSVALSHFLDKIGASSKDIRSLRINNFWYAPDSGKHLDKLYHLQSLSLDAPSELEGWPIESPIRAADAFFEKAYRWVRGMASVHKDTDYLRAVRSINVDCPTECLCRVISKNDPSTYCQWKSEFRNELKRNIEAWTIGSTLFLKFPRKVRDLIYSHAMVTDEKIMVQSDADTGSIERFGFAFDDNDKVRGILTSGFLWSASVTAALLRVDRQIYQESVQVLYGKNSFCFGYARDLQPFLDNIGYSYVYLRSIQIWGLPQDFNVLCKLPNLDELYLDITSESSSEKRDSITPEEEARIFYDKAGKWIECSGAHRPGGRSDAIDRIHFECTPAPSLEESEDWEAKFKEGLKRLCE